MAASRKLMALLVAAVLLCLVVAEGTAGSSEGSSPEINSHQSDDVVLDSDAVDHKDVPDEEANDNTKKTMAQESLVSYWRQLVLGSEPSTDEVNKKKRNSTLWTRYIAHFLEYYYSLGFPRPPSYGIKELENDDLTEELGLEEDSKEIKPLLPPPRHVNCSLRKVSDDSTPNKVLIVNDTSLQQLLKNEKNTNNTSNSQEAVCQTLLLYAPWCVFSARLAPYYNALSRAFPDLEILAINAVTLNYWNARFGTVAVPNVLLFHNGKFISKFNHTEKDLKSLTWFIQNFTTLWAVDGVNVTDEDYIGPVPSEPSEQMDYYLLLSWVVIAVAALFGIKKCNLHLSIAATYHRLTNLFNYEHPHID